MVTLKRFLETGELGPLHCGMNEMDVKNNIYYAAPRSEQPKKQIAVPVSKEDFERLSALARKAKKSIADLIAEGIPGIIREHNRQVPGTPLASDISSG